MKKLSRLALATAVASSTMAMGTAALGAVGLEEIVVTARKREEAIQDVPVAVTAVTGEAYERAVLLNFEEATSLTPGFSVPPSSTSNLTPAFSMRGSVQTDALVTVDPSVGIYMDGAYIARSYGIGVDLLDLKDVQVLKGPQGTLFGRNSTAGAMLLNTNNPELEEFTATISATGSQDLTRHSAIVNIPLGERFAFRFAGQESERDDYVTNEPNDAKSESTTIGGKESSMFRGKLRFMPTDDLDMVLSYERFEASENGPAADQLWLSGITPDFDRGDDTVSLSFDPYDAVDTETITFMATYSADWGELKFVANEREWQEMREIDYDGGDYAVDPTKRAGRRHGSWGRQAGDQNSYELQLTTSLLDDAVDLVGGIIYFEEFGQLYDYSYGLDPKTDPGLFYGGAYVENNVESLGYYSQATWHINEVSNLTVGLRYTDDNKFGEVYGSSSNTGTQRLPSWDFDAHKASMFNFLCFLGFCGQPFGTIVPSTVLRPDADFSSTDWLISYDYKITDDILVYGKVSTGFRAGGFNGRGVSDPSVPFVFEPEEIQEYEIGLKGDFLDGKLRWNTAVYKNETTDKQFTTIFAVGGVSGTSVLNAGAAEAEGFETEFTYLLHENWSLSGTYAYIDSGVTELVSAGQPVPDDELPLPQFIPENEWSLTLNYDQEFDGFRVAGTATYAWIDEMLGNDDAPAQSVIETAPYASTGLDLTLEEAQAFADAATTDAYGLLNLNITVSPLDDRYSVSLWGKNVLDERKIKSTIGFISGNAYQYVRGNYTEPRMWGVTVTANF